MLQWNKFQWCGHVLRTEQRVWVRNVQTPDYKLEPWGRPKIAGVQNLKIFLFNFALNKADAMVCCKWSYGNQTDSGDDDWYESVIYTIPPSLYLLSFIFATRLFKNISHCRVYCTYYSKLTYLLELFVILLSIFTCS